MLGSISLPSASDNPSLKLKIIAIEILMVVAIIIIFKRRK